MRPGRRLLTVTLRSATSRHTPARKAVSPARAPEERSRPAIGVSTDSEVMLTMRPKPRAAMPSITAVISSIGVTMFWTTPAMIFSRSSSRKSRRGGPPLLLTRMSGSGQAASSSACTSGMLTSPTTGVDRDAEAVGDVGRGQRRARPRSRPLRTRSHAVLGERHGAAAPEPAARRADDRLPAGNSEIQDPPPL